MKLGTTNIKCVKLISEADTEGLTATTSLLCTKFLQCPHVTHTHSVSKCSESIINFQANIIIQYFIKCRNMSKLTTCLHESQFSSLIIPQNVLPSQSFFFPPLICHLFLNILFLFSFTFSSLVILLT